MKLLLEEAPRGKGHAVRAGFVHATGDIVLIQDADLEYDLNDYDGMSLTADSGTLAVVKTERQANVWVAPTVDAGSFSSWTIDVPDRTSTTRPTSPSGAIAGVILSTWSPRPRFTVSDRAQPHSARSPRASVS